ncbi:hypothetical protein ACG7MM_004432 [Escherichia coli]|nr:hypothetical protein [Escherichia coli]HCO5732519.1 hypothetical protein [Escherichia coli]HCO7665326.1 hypothetical protein [Escherichia coli]HEI3897849.1 hypothetical protein [Escherichia coli]
MRVINMMFFYNWHHEIRINSIISLAICGVISFMSLSANAEESLGQLTTNIIVNYQPPACNISLPKEVDLGQLTHGVTKHPSFNITIDCPDDRTVTSLTVSPKGVILSDQVSMVMAGADDGTALRLMNNGQYIKFNSGFKFCSKSGTALRKCEVTPETKVSSAVKPGPVKGIISFTISYS